MGTVNCYLDASVLAALLRPEVLSERADRFVEDNAVGLLVSDFAAAEFASAVARWVRMRELSRDEGLIALESFDRWVGAFAQHVEIRAEDLRLATAFLRRLDLSLRTPDAIHIAIAQRLEATLVTFDRQMAASARALGAAVAQP